MSARIHITILRNMTPCNWVNTCHCFGVTSVFQIRKGSFENFVSIQKTTWRHISEDRNLKL